MCIRDRKTTAKKATTRKITRKPVTKSRLNRKDLLAISKLAKLSISTLVKWNEGSLSVKPETELKIFNAVDRFYAEEALRLEEHFDKLTEIEERIAAKKKSVKAIIRDMKSSK